MTATEPQINPPQINPAKVRAIIAHAMAGLDPADRADRIAWCQQHDQHGTTMYPSLDDDVVEFRWGGHPLAIVPVDVLTGKGPPLLRGQFITPVPDTPAELDDGEPEAF